MSWTTTFEGFPLSRIPPCTTGLCFKMVNYTCFIGHTLLHTYAAGRNGSDGLPGVKGSQGPPGLIGIKGKKGEIGLTGPRGKPGLKGFAGHNGTDGTPGTPGIDGDIGTQVYTVRIHGLFMMSQKVLC